MSTARQRPASPQYSSSTQVSVTNIPLNRSNATLTPARLRSRSPEAQKLTTVNSNVSSKTGESKLVLSQRMHSTKMAEDDARLLESHILRLEQERRRAQIAERATNARLEQVRQQKRERERLQKEHQERRDAILKERQRETAAQRSESQMRREEYSRRQQQDLEQRRQNAQALKDRRAQQQQELERLREEYRQQGVTRKEMVHQQLEETHRMTMRQMDMRRMAQQYGTQEAELNALDTRRRAAERQIEELLRREQELMEEVRQSRESQERMVSELEGELLMPESRSPGATQSFGSTQSSPNRGRQSNNRADSSSDRDMIYPPADTPEPEEDEAGVGAAHNGPSSQAGAGTGAQTSGNEAASKEEQPQEEKKEEVVPVEFDASGLNPDDGSLDGAEISLDSSDLESQD